MRKVRFYAAFEKNIHAKDLFKKSVDGYLDDGGEAAYYHHIEADQWFSILLTCGAMIVCADKLYECVEKTKPFIEEAKRIEKNKGYDTIFQRMPVDKGSIQICWNHWAEHDHFIDLTTDEGWKMLKTMKSKKCKKKPLSKAQT